MSLLSWFFSQTTTSQKQPLCCVLRVVAYLRELIVFYMGVLPPGERFDFNSTTYLLGISLFHTWCTLNFYSKKTRNLVNLYLYLSDIQQDKLWHISYFHEEFQVLNNYVGNFLHIWTHQSKKKKNQKITFLIQLIEPLQG